MRTAVECVDLGVRRRSALATSLAVVGVLAGVLVMLTRVAGTAPLSSSATMAAVRIPDDAVWQAGQNRWGEPAPGAEPRTTSAAAIRYFRDHAFYGHAEGLLPPEVDLYFFSSPISGIRHRLAWFLTFHNAPADPVAAHIGVLTGCIETYVVDATLGVALDDGVTCPTPR